MGVYVFSKIWAPSKETLRVWVQPVPNVVKCTIWPGRHALSVSVQAFHKPMDFRILPQSFSQQLPLTPKREPRPLGLGVVPVGALAAVRHLLLEFLDLGQPPAAHVRHVVGGHLGAAEREGAAELALAAVVLPLEAVVLRLAQLRAILSRLSGCALEIRQLGPLAPVEVEFGVGRVSLSVGQVGPVLADGDEEMLDKVVEDIFP